MDAQLATTKRLLTRFINKLELVVGKFKADGRDQLDVKLDGDSQGVNKENLKQLEEAVGAIDSLMAQGESRSTGKGSEKKQVKTAAKVNLVMDERLGVEDGAGEQYNEVYDGAVLGIQPSRDPSTPLKTFLPLGEVAVVDPKAKNMRKVQVLIDTGAEISFIESTLADELTLSTVEEKQLRYFTFGSDQVQVKWSRRVKLPLWDNNGKFHMLDLLT
ncbi:hypothetical protein GCK32_021862, partial [Trichostrongylus colubriformis]